MGYVNKGSMATSVTVSMEPDRSGNFRCNGTADDVEINLAANYTRALGTEGAELIILDGSYNVTAQIDFTDINVIMLGEIVVSSAYHGVAVEAGAGTPGQVYDMGVYELRVRRASATSTAGDIGIRLNTCKRSHITIFDASYFYWGVVCRGYGEGFAYNEVDLYRFYYEHDAGLVLIDEDVNSNHGFVNENLFFNGNFHAANNAGIYLAVGDVGAIDNNVFIKPCVEGAPIGILFEAGAKNNFYNVRSELATYVAQYNTSINPPRQNVIEVGLGVIDVNETIADHESWVYTLNEMDSLYEPLKIEYKAVFAEDFVGKALRSTDTWQEAFGGAGGGSAALLSGQGFGVYRQSTGVANGATCILNFNGVLCTRSFDFTRFKVRIQPVELTNMEIHIYLRNDDNNYIGFYYLENVGGAATNWFARCCNGGALTAVDTGIAASATTFKLEAWIKSTSEVEFRINGELVATITTNVTALFLEPYLYLINNAGVNKRVQYDYVSLETRRP